MTTTTIEVKPANRTGRGFTLPRRAAKAPDGPPRMPRRPPPSARVRRPLSPRERVVRSSLAIVAALLLGFALNVVVLSHLQHSVSQQQLADAYAEQLSAGTAPVAEGDFEDVLLDDGAPLGVLSIPSIGVNEILVEGTSATTLKLGPGHRRDTVLPGQEGTSVLMGRAAAYGGPFARIQELAPGEKFTIITGQGTQHFEVIGVRYAGDPAPPAVTAGHSRLILETARGAAYVPSGIAYVDAELEGAAEDRGARQTVFTTLAPEDLPMASDTSTAWALVFALQFLLVVEGAAVWAFTRIGARKTWIVFVPVTVLAGLYVANQVTILLPNLL